MYLSDFFKIAHDGLIEGISYQGKDQLTLYLRLKSETKFRLIFSGVLECRVVDFGMQNIISRILVFQDESHNDEDILKVLNWVSSDVDSSSYLTEDKSDQIFNKIKYGDLKLIYLEPSIGAECAILFKNCIVESIDG
ncbi:hypothetical protein [Acinetobacter baylyi]|uniref:hypothetical protein n=1 Tax=Acinetobacter baylyi TaxID=202950 RepID=UPI0031D911C8